MKAIILSAGRGERLKPITDDIPKPLIPVGNKPLLWYNLSLLKKYGVNEVGVNTSYLADKIKSSFGGGSAIGMKINYSFEPELLGTSGALNNFRDFLNEPFFVIYGDNLTNIDLAEMKRYHEKRGGVATIFLQRETMRDRGTTPGIVIIDDEKKIQKFMEKPSQQEIEEIKKIPEDRKFNNSGIYLLELSVLDYIPRGKSDFCLDIFPAILSNGRKIFGFRTNCFFRELGSLKRYFYTINEIKNGKLKLEELI